ncbi:MAG TPA: magnesium transporter [Oscillospiraceae bacterium]|nr:magnesium transporter [Oscillospiraceae bacterium]
MEAISFEKLFALLRENRIKELKNQLVEMNVVDIAEFMMELEGEKQLLVFRILPKDLSAMVFAYLEPEIQQRIVEYSSDKEVNFLVEELYVDDAVDFLEEVPANVVKRVLANASPETRDVINKFLKYPEDSAGSLMTIEFVELHDRFTVADAIRVIRKTGLDKETIYTCYVIDDQRHLVGILPLRRLLLSEETARIHDIMADDEQIISVHTLEDQETVAEIARKYDLLSVPVVDNENRLVGIITIDDIVDIIEEENTEDFEKMALLQPAEQEYLKSSVFTLARNRIVWLLILMVSATFTGKIIENFEGMLALVVGLTACIPMLMDTCGNAGTQVSTLIIRGLALGEITIGDYLKVLFKEVRVALLCGAALAVVNFGRMMVLGSGGGVPVYLVVCATMLCAVVVSKCIGCTLPIVAKSIHLDPALMAGPMLTTIVDAITLAIYFSLAKAFLL